MARDDYGAISVISDDEREALGLGGRKPDEEEGLFETIGKAGDKLGETQLGKKLGSILTVLILAFFGSGAEISALDDLFGGEEEPVSMGGCMDVTAINYNADATFDNGSCVFPPPVIYGCTNPDADNYNPQATHDNGRCQFLGGPVNNGTGNNNTDDKVYGCTDPEAENYNSRADEDDGSCEYEEYDCTSNETYFYDGLEYGNYSREPNTLNITVDVDTDCDQDELPIMIGYDVGHIKKNEDNETVWNGYMWNDFYFNVTGWEGDEFNLISGPEYFTEPYTGWYIVYVNLYADWNRNGEYEYVTYFVIEEITLEEP
mgnify:FL=1